MEEAGVDLACLEDYPNAYYTATHEVSLPIYSGMPSGDMDAVIRAVNLY